MKYKKRNIVVDAVQILAPDWGPSGFDGPPFTETPEWLQEALLRQVYPFGDDRDYALWKVRDKDGFEHTAEPDDYLIYDEDKGTITTCKSRIFKLVYDPVEVEA